MTDRSINIQGNVTGSSYSTSDGASNAQTPLAVEIRKAIRALQDALEDASKPTVDSSEIAAALGRASKAIAKASAADQSEWVSTQDQLPEKRQDYYLIVNRVGDILIAWIDTAGHWGSGSGYEHWRGVQYWMPLPELPEMLTED